MGSTSKADVVELGVGALGHLQAFAKGEACHSFPERPEGLGGQVGERGTAVQDRPISFLINLLQTRFSHLRNTLLNGFAWSSFPLQDRAVRLTRLLQQHLAIRLRSLLCLM